MTEAVELCKKIDKNSREGFKLVRTIKYLLPNNDISKLKDLNAKLTQDMYSVHFYIDLVKKSKSKGYNSDSDSDAGRDGKRKRNEDNKITEKKLKKRSKTVKESLFMPTLPPITDTMNATTL